MESKLLQKLFFSLLLSLLVTMSHLPNETLGLRQVLENGGKVVTTRENHRAMTTKNYHNNYFHSKKSFDKNANDFLDYDLTDTKKNKQFLVGPTAGDNNNIEFKPTTLDVIHTTIRVLGVFATFFAFIVTPIIHLIISAVVTGKEFARSFSSLQNPFIFDQMHNNSNGTSSSSSRSSRSFGSMILAEEEARGILDTSRCLERVYCYAQTNGRSFLQSFERKTFMEGGRQSDVCAQYLCYPFSFIVRLFIYLIDWNTLLKV